MPPKQIKAAQRWRELIWQVGWQNLLNTPSLNASSCPPPPPLLASTPRGEPCKCYYWKCCNQMKAKRPCGGYFGVLPKPQASTGLCSYVRSLRGDILRKGRCFISITMTESARTPSGVSLCGNFSAAKPETVYMVTQYLALVSFWGFFMGLDFEKKWLFWELDMLKWPMCLFGMWIWKEKDKMWKSKMYLLMNLLHCSVSNFKSAVVT